MSVNLICSVVARKLRNSAAGAGRRHYKQSYYQSVITSTASAASISHRRIHFGQVMSTENRIPHSKAKLMTNDDWAKKLTAEQYFVTREQGTEPPFTGKYYNYTQDGVYHCVCCNADLFSSKTKYDSGSGWPSFYEAMKHAETDGSETGVLKRTDMSNGMVRTECICRNCSAHLGHVFEDGPDPTGERYCINSAALKFQPKKM